MKLDKSLNWIKLDKKEVNEVAPPVLYSLICRATITKAASLQLLACAIVEPSCKKLVIIISWGNKRAITEQHEPGNYYDGSEKCAHLATFSELT